MMNWGNSAASSSRRKVEREGNPPFLPDDILIEILSWLPAKDVLKYRRVCRKWMDLISTNDFVDLHTQRGMIFSIPIVLIDQYNSKTGSSKNHVFLDKWCVPARKKAQIHRFNIFPDCRTCFSQSGFLILLCDKNREIIIGNPINGENVRIVIPTERLYCSTRVYGIFFNPTLQEYCALLGILHYNDNLQTEIINYKMLNLGCQPCWREIRTPLNRKIRIPDCRPILINEYLYWLVNHEQEYLCGIIEYNISTEVFRFMHGPLLKTVDCYYFNMDLLNIDGSLSLIAISRCESLVDVKIWTLKDCTEHLWTSSNYHFSGVAYSALDKPRALAVVDGELLIHRDQKLFVCNLKCGTIRKFGKSNYSKYISFFPHVIGLASLRNCKSKIYMEVDDDSTEALGL